MEDNTTPIVEPIVEEQITESVSEPVVDSVPSEDQITQNTLIEEPNLVAEEDGKNIENETEFKAETSEDSVDNIPVVDNNAEKYALLESENEELKNKLTELETKFNELNIEYEALVAFKAKVEDAEKDAMIAKFAMLSEEDKADVIQNKSKYTVEDIESKLSVICVRKKVNFDLSNNSKINNNMSGKVFTYNIDTSKENNAPAWVQAVKNNTTK